MFNRGIPSGWEEFFETNKTAFALANKVLIRPENSPYTPKDDEILESYRSCPLQNVRVVILVEAPYPTVFESGVTEACGIALSGRPGYRIPSSLRNVFEELNRQYPNLPTQTDGNIINWCKQGVLPLNAKLTYHPKKEKLNFWCGIVERTLLECIKQNNDLIIVAWGKIAQDAISNDVRKAIQSSNVKVLECGHPSSRNISGSFQGNGHFIEINKIFRDLGQTEIDWNTVSAPTEGWNTTNHTTGWNTASAPAEGWNTTNHTTGWNTTNNAQTGWNPVIDWGSPNPMANTNTWYQ